MKTLQVIVSRTDNFEELHHLQAVIASRAVNFWCTNFLADDMNKVYLQGIPVPQFSPELAKLSCFMLAFHQHLFSAKTPGEKTSLERQITATDTQIDQLVYELYGLTDDEIKIVEEATRKG
jgi:hypothetical protein